VYRGWRIEEKGGLKKGRKKSLVRNAKRELRLNTEILTVDVVDKEVIKKKRKGF